MDRNRAAWWVPRLAVAAAGVAVIGFASSLASRGPAERAAAARIAAAVGIRNVYVLADGPSSSIRYPGSASVLAGAGFTVRDCHRSDDRFDCFPWAGAAPARVVAPFLVEVRWAAAGAGLAGHGLRTRYLVFFGLVLPIRDAGGWVS